MAGEDTLERLTSEAIAAHERRFGRDAAYEEGEKVFAFHQNMLYEAKVLRREVQAGAMAYFIHYQGWKDRWDEWVPAARILKHTPELKDYQARMRDEKASRKRKARSPSAAATAVAPPPTKRRRAPTARKALSSWAPPLPQPLRLLLLADRRHVSQHRLVRIPAKPSVADILVVYADEKQRRREAMHTSVLDGIQLYFERALGTLLLYRFEKLQYRQLLQRQRELASPAGVVPASSRFSHLYGGAHLLRLLSKMPELLSDVQLEAEARTLIQQYVEDLLAFLETHADTVFDSDAYAAASAAYLEEAV